MLRAEKIQCVSAVALVLLALTACTPSPSTLARQGAQALEAGEPARAVELLEAAAIGLPADPRVLNLLGVALHSAGRTLEADAAYQRVLSISPVLPEALLNRADVLAELGDHQAAHDLAAQFLQGRNKSADGWIRLGLEQIALGKLTGTLSAEASLTYAATLDADSSRALNAIGLLRSAQKRDADAAAAFAKAVEINPATAPARLNLALMQLKRRETNAALVHLEAYLALTPAPANRDAVATLLESLRAPAPPAASVPQPKAAPPAQVSNPPVAVAPKQTPPPEKKQSAAPVPATNTPARPAPVKTAPATSPKSTAPTPVKAAAAPVQVAKAAPATSPAPAQTAAKAAPAGVKRYSYSKLPAPLAGNRRVAQPYFDAGMAALKAKNYRLAMTEFATAVTADPAYFEAHYNLGYAAQQNRDAARAAEAYERALSINPTHAEVRYNFAFALNDQKCWYDALVELDKVLAADPAHVSAHLLSAGIYADSAKDKALARQHYQRVLELEPSHPRAASIRDWLTVNPR